MRDGCYRCVRLGRWATTGRSEASSLSRHRLLHQHPPARPTLWNRCKPPLFLWKGLEVLPNYPRITRKSSQVNPPASTSLTYPLKLVQAHHSLETPPSFPKLPNHYPKQHPSYSNSIHCEIAPKLSETAARFSDPPLFYSQAAFSLPWNMVRPTMSPKLPRYLTNSSEIPQNPNLTISIKLPVVITNWWDIGFPTVGELHSGHYAPYYWVVWMHHTSFAPFWCSRLISKQ